MKEKSKNPERPTLETAKVSYFSFFGAKKTFTSSLFWCLTTDKEKKRVERIRDEVDPIKAKHLKLKMSAFTTSGIFEHRSSNGLREHSHHIAIDFDGKDNPNIKDWQGFVRYGLSDVPFISFAGLSVSGRGAFAVIPIKEPERHTQHFDAIVRDLSSLAKVDKSGRDVGRLRFMSYNRNPYINHYAEVYSDFIEPVKAERKAYTGTDKNIQKLYDKIMLSQINITFDYYDWFSLACSLRDVPNGRNIFHDISTMDARYQFERCELEFDNAVNDKSNGRKIGVGTFFMICKNYGVTFK